MAYIFTLLAAAATGIIYLGSKGTLDLSPLSLAITIGVFVLCAVLAVGYAIDGYMDYKAAKQN